MRAGKVFALEWRAACAMMGSTSRGEDTCLTSSVVPFDDESPAFRNRFF